LSKKAFVLRLSENHDPKTGVDEGSQTGGALKHEMK
jgi:hypothetical protein